jgi:hypothetical protein
MNEALSLRDATVKEIQLELLRRTTYNALDGERVADSLLRHRDLWLAFLLDRQGLPNYAEPTRLLMMDLIKLRDLPDNSWNADTLFVLTPTHTQAHELARIAEEEDWAGEVYVCKIKRKSTAHWEPEVMSMRSWSSGGIEPHDPIVGLPQSLDAGSACPSI